MIRNRKQLRIIFFCAISRVLSNAKVYDSKYFPHGTYCVDKLSRDFMDAVNRLRTQGVESDVFKAL